MTKEMVNRTARNIRQQEKKTVKYIWLNNNQAR